MALAASGRSPPRPPRVPQGRRHPDQVGTALGTTGAGTGDGSILGFLGFSENALAHSFAALVVAEFLGAAIFALLWRLPPKPSRAPRPPSRRRRPTPPGRPT